MTRRPRPARSAATLALATALAVAGIGVAAPAAAGAVTASTRPAAADTGRSASDKVTKLTLRTNVRSTDSTLHTLPGGVVYGWNLLQGTTSWGGTTADVEFLGSVSYVDGNGPFVGLVTITRPNGTTLSLRVDGTSVSTAAGSGTADARFTGDVVVLGGTGNWARSRGNGTFVGTRTAELGGAVRMTYRLDIVR